MFTSYSNHKKSNKCNYIIGLAVKKGIFFIFLLVFAFCFFTNNYQIKCDNFQFAHATEIEEDLNNSTNDILDDLDFGELDEVINNIDVDFDLLNGLTFKEFVAKVIKGEQTINFLDVFNILASGFRQTFKDLLAPLLLILVVVLLCTMFNNIKSQKVSGVSEIIYFICFSVIVLIVATICSSLIAKVKDSLLSINKQMNAVFPILLTLMTLMGGVVSVKAYTPMLAFLSNVISNIFMYVLLPLFTFSLILAIVGNLSKNTKLGKLNSFINSTFKWVIGSVFAIFMSFLSLQGITAGASDGISIKATKYAIKNYIPMLGGYISEGFELVKASGMLVKNATGFVSIIVLLSSIVAPILCIAVIELGLKLLAGVVEPIGDNRSSSLIYDIAKTLKMLVVILVGISLMYFLTIYLITCSVSNFI